MNKSRIAIIGDGGEWTTIPVIRELREDYILLGFFTDKNKPIKKSAGLSSHTAILKSNHKKFHKNLLYKLYRFRVDIIICLNEEIKLSLVKNKNLYYNFNFAFPSYKSYITAIEKNRSIRFVRDLGIPIPKIFDYNEITDLDNLKTFFPKKIVVKGDRGVSSLNVEYVTSFKDLKKAHKKFKSVDENDNEVNPIVQEYIGGPTYLTQAICQNGVVKATVSHIKIREWPITGGVTCFAHTIHDSKLENYTKKILEKLEWHGEAGIEWKYSEKNNEYYFIELNPRFEGSLDLTVSSGINYPKLLVDIINKKSLKKEYKYSKNIYYRWFFRLDFEHFLNEPYGIINFFSETFDTRINGEIKINSLSDLRCVWKYPIYTLAKRIRK
jgi:hypothetical protein